MFEDFPILSTGIQLGAGVADAALASYDTDSWMSNPANTAKTQNPPLAHIGARKAMWFDLALIGLGLVGEFADWHPDITEPTLGAGVTLASRTVTYGLIQNSKPTPVPAQGYSVPTAAYGVPVSAPARALQVGGRAMRAAAYRKETGVTLAG